MHTMQIVYQIANLYQVRLMVELIFFCFHGLSSIKSFTPFQRVGPTRNLAITLEMSVQLDTLIIPQFVDNFKFIFCDFGPFQ